jgi:hypothetical protein
MWFVDLVSENYKSCLRTILNTVIIANKLFSALFKSPLGDLRAARI